MRLSSELDATWRAEIKTAYTPYHIWLAKNMGVFEVRWLAIRFVVERVLTLIMEMTKFLLPDVTFKTQDIRDSPTHPSFMRRVFISWESPSPSFLKINIDGSVMDGRGKQGLLFIARTPGSLRLAVFGWWRPLCLGLSWGQHGRGFVLLNWLFIPTGWLSRMIPLRSWPGYIDAPTMVWALIPLCATSVIYGKGMPLATLGISTIRWIVPLTRVPPLLCIILVHLFGLMFSFGWCPSSFMFFWVIFILFFMKHPPYQTKALIYINIEKWIIRERERELITKTNPFLFSTYIWRLSFKFSNISCQIIMGFH